MNDHKAIKELSYFETNNDLSEDKWHHADTQGISVRLQGATLSNAHTPSVDGHECCLVIARDGTDKVVLNVANLLADACEMNDLLHAVSCAMAEQLADLKPFCE